jgi:transposase
VGQRTALVNQIRGLLHEYGIVLPQGIRQVRSRLPELLEDGENALTMFSRELFADLYDEFRCLDERVAGMERKIQWLFRHSEVCRRIARVEGIGPITATALVATVGDAGAFRNGREMAAWLGLVPRQSSTGGRSRLLGISKRGDRYLRTLLIHGARSVVRAAERKNDTRSSWIMELKARRGNNIASVAVANKNVRIIWALMTRDEEYLAAT